MPQLPKPLVLHWTLHSRQKMRFYGLSEQRVRRVLHSPARTEEGVAPKTFAMMQPAGNGRHELWVMFQDRGRRRFVISAWRYPGRTKPRSQVALELMRAELQAYAKSAAPVREEKKTAVKKKMLKTKWFKRPLRKNTSRAAVIDLNG